MTGIPDVSTMRAWHADVPFQEDHLGRIDVEQPRKGRKPFLLRLDTVGSDVWRMLDGRRVSQIAAALPAMHPGVEDVPQRLSKLLSQLYQLGLVRFED